MSDINDRRRNRILKKAAERAAACADDDFLNDSVTIARAEKKEFLENVYAAEWSEKRIQTSADINTVQMLLSGVSEDRKAFVQAELEKARERILEDKSKVDVTEVTARATKMWKFVEKYKKEHSEFMELSDSDKLKLFRNKLGYSEIMHDLPVVAKYMICLNQYSAKALEKALIKYHTKKHPPVHKQEKDYMKLQWLEHQADYVKFLFEAVNYKRRPSPSEANEEWQNAYNLLKGEFDDFQDRYKKIEKGIAEEKKKFASMNARELLMKLVESKDTALPPEHRRALERQLYDVHVRSRHRSVMEDIAKRKPSETVVHGIGAGPAEDAPRITMIETVDSDRYDEIDDKFKSAAEDDVYEEIISDEWL